MLSVTSIGAEHDSGESQSILCSLASCPSLSSSAHWTRWPVLHVEYVFTILHLHGSFTLRHRLHRFDVFLSLELLQLVSLLLFLVCWFSLIKSSITALKSSEPSARGDVGVGDEPLISSTSLWSNIFSVILGIARFTIFFVQKPFIHTSLFLSFKEMLFCGIKKSDSNQAFACKSLASLFFRFLIGLLLNKSLL